MTNNKIKLSPAQLTLLKERNGSCVETYKPMLKLVEYEMVTTTPQKYGNVRWEITKLGEEFLAASA